MIPGLNVQFDNMRELLLLGRLMAILFALSIQPTLTVTDERLVPSDPQFSEGHQCTWTLQILKRGSLRFIAAAWCPCYQKVLSKREAAFSLLFWQPVSACLINCLRSLQEYPCFSSPKWWFLQSFLRICCTQCNLHLARGTSSNRSFTCFRKRVTSVIPTIIPPSTTPTVSEDSLTLAGVDESFSPELNLEVVQENILSILLSPSILVFFRSYPTVTGIPLISEESFIKSNPGERFSLAYILAASPSITPYSPHTPLPPRPSLAPTLTSNIVRMQYKCYAKQCGVQVDIRSEKVSWAHAIGKAIEKLRVGTPNFSSVFVSDRNLIQMINRAGLWFTVFIPYKRFYLEKLRPQLKSLLFSY